MSKGRIFLVGSNENEWHPMDETPYAQENVLQQALASYPDLLPGDQINPESPRRWLFVGREISAPAMVDGGSVGILDHLFIDQDGVPTLVECKRAADTRSRREVVAQMLDYAANGSEYWSKEKLRQIALETARKRGQDLDSEIQNLLQEEEIPDTEAFWDLVENNLREGQLRLIFVADTIPQELRRLVEFLNGKMNHVEVLAVEVKQFLGEEHKAMVPRLVGMTEAARRIKRKHTTREEILSKCNTVTAEFFKHVWDMAESKGHTVYLGEKGFSLRASNPENDRLRSFVYGFPSGLFQFYFAQLPLNEEEKLSLRSELLNFNLFQPSGKHTLSATVSDNTINTLHEVFAFILNKIDDIIHSE